MLRISLLFLAFCSSLSSLNLGDRCEDNMNACDASQDLTCRVASYYFGIATCVKDTNKLYNSGEPCYADKDCDADSECRLWAHKLGFCVKTSRLGNKGDPCTGGNRGSCRNGLYCNVRRELDRFGNCVRLE